MHVFLFVHMPVNATRLFLSGYEDRWCAVSMSSNMCVCVDREVQRDGEKRKKVTDSHVLKLGQSGLLCQNLLMPTRHIPKLDNLGRQIGVSTIKSDTSLIHTHKHTLTPFHNTNHFDICIWKR